MLALKFFFWETNSRDDAAGQKAISSVEGVAHDEVDGSPCTWVPSRPTAAAQGGGWSRHRRAANIPITVFMSGIEGHGDRCIAAP